MDLLFEANRLAGELASELRKTLITEADNKTSDSTERTIVAYSGNFQPFHAGHYKIYRTLVKKFGRDNVYITTTNQQAEPENPMSYEDKKTLVTNMFDIEDGKFQEVKNPFIPIELLKKFNPKTTSLVTVVSTDDVDVIAKSKYFHKYVEGQDLKHYTEAGYYLTIPELTMAVGGLQLTDAQIMQVLNSPKTSDGVKSQVFKSVFGSENDEMLNLVSNSSAEDGDTGSAGKTDAKGHKNYTTPDKTKASGQENEPEDESDKDKTPPMQRMVVNPETGREIKVQSALKYPRWKPVYKKAEKVLKSAGIDRKDRVKEPEVNTRYKERAKNMKKEDLVAYLGHALSEQLHDIVSVDGATLTVPGLGEVHLKLDNSFLPGLKTESDSPAPVAIFGGRFQPYHAGHQHSYEDLVKKFGKDNVYIATSDKTNADTSPLNFEEKKKIMTQMFGIDPSKIVQVVSPYKADEITSKLPSNTPVVWALGEKDIQRLAKSKYFSPYDPPSQAMKGYKDGGYVYEVPQLPVQINGQTISGTAIRNVFAQGSPEAQRALFKRLYGKDDPQVLSLLSGRIKSGPPEVVPTNQPEKQPPTSSGSKRDRSKDKIKNPETDNDIQVDTALKYEPTHPAHKAARKYLQTHESITEQFLVEGGAYGHLLHPYEDLDLTFGDMRELVSRALGTGLDKHGPVTEKTDGQNIMFTVRDGQVKFARSAGQIKNRGELAMTPDELRQKFTGRGVLEKTFGTAGDDLQSAIEKMSPEEVTSIFDNGRKFMSVEVIHPDSENTIPYDKKVLILHHTIEFDDAGNPQGHYPEDSERMTDALRKVGADQQGEFGIRGQHFIVFDDSESEQLKKKMENYNKEIDQFESTHGLTDKNTIRDYKRSWWMQKLNRSDVPLTPQDKEILLSRWVDGNKSQRLTALSSPTTQAWAKKAESNAKNMDNELIYPIQSLVARLGVDSLSRATDLLASHNPNAAKSIKDKLAQALNAIRQSGDVDKISQIDRFMKLIDTIGLDRIAPSEGLLFNYNGKLYKFTGAFAPINRVIGTVKYAANAPAAQAPPEQPVQDKPSRMDKLTARATAPEEPVDQHTTIDPTMTVKNPETDNDILVKTALKYDKSHPAYKAAKKAIGR